jgi:hypothetical protein
MMWSDASLAVSIQITRLTKMSKEGSPVKQDAESLPYLLDDKPNSVPVFLLSRLESYRIKVLLVHKKGNKLPMLEICGMLPYGLVGETTGGWRTPVMKLLQWNMMHYALSNA